VASPDQIADVAVIGAGPAGLAGAITAADGGCRVTVLDQGQRPGGQYWRHPPATLGGGVGPSPHGWRMFARLLRRFEAHQRAGRIEYLPETAVWRLDRDDVVSVRAMAGERRPAARTVRAQTALVATGAFDRHVPFRGWTLPGVMAVGGAQSLLKGSGLAPGRRIVVAGTGPFLLPAAEGLLRAGAEVAAVVEASRPAADGRALRTVAAVPEKLVEAAGYALVLARHRVPYLVGRAVVEAHGTQRLDGVTIRRVGPDWTPRGPTRTIACDTLAVGFGFVPQLELLLQLGCQMRVDASGVAVTVVDSRQETTVADVFAAGEPTGVGGAELAVAEGTLAGDAIVSRLGHGAALDARPRAAAVRRRSRLRAFAELLAVAYPVAAGWRAWCDETTVVCRCEEVTVAEVAEAVALGADDPRAVKLLARPGMGWCQGRICGAAVAALAGELSGRAPGEPELRSLAQRSFAVPVPLEVLADETAP
jgi:D-hydroxyproline dehydrogenase subunit alpha